MSGIHSKTEIIGLISISNCIFVLQYQKTKNALCLKLVVTNSYRVVGKKHPLDFSQFLLVFQILKFPDVFVFKIRLREKTKEGRVIFPCDKLNAEVHTYIRDECLE